VRLLCCKMFTFTNGFTDRTSPHLAGVF